jgi:short-subunit dehydrogenase
MKIDHCSALITGASAGIGREFARQLAGRARSLTLVARREQKLGELRDELRQQYPNLTVRIRDTDLADPAQLKELMAWLDYEKMDVDLLINNAGLGDLGSFATSDPIRNEQMMFVNMVAATSLTRHLLPEMIARKRGGILNVSSSAGFLPIPEFAIYAATKAYVTSFSEALRAELRGTGVSVCALCPGPVHTEFQEVAKRPGGQRENGPEFVHVPVEQVVRDALTGLEADRPLVIPGLAMKIGMVLVRITPMSILRWASRFSPKRPQSAG